MDEILVKVLPVDDLLKHVTASHGGCLHVLVLVVLGEVGEGQVRDIVPSQATTPKPKSQQQQNQDKTKQIQSTQDNHNWRRWQTT